MDTPKKKKILIVEDSEVLAQALKNVLEREEFEVLASEEVQGALHLIKLEVPDVVVSDIRMPGRTGLELLSEIKQSYPTIPVILMTGFSEIESMEQAHALGAQGFLPKPFKKEDLLKLLRSLLSLEGSDESRERETKDEEFASVQMEEFISGSKIQYPIFIRLAKDRFVQIANQGENLDQARIDAYKEKGVHCLHLKRDDFFKYVEFSVNIATAVSQSERIAIDQKVRVLRHTVGGVFQEILATGIDPKRFELAQEAVHTTLMVVESHPKALNLLLSLKDQGDWLLNHSTAVSTFAVLLGRELKWQSQATLQKLALGGLFHDIGKREISRELVNKPRVELTVEEVKILETHTTRGASILSSMPGVGDDIIQIALQHHEDCLGMGFPRRLTRNEIHPLAKVVGVASEFCGYVIKNPNSSGLPPRQAVQKIKSLRGSELDEELLNLLVQLFP